MELEYLAEDKEMLARYGKEQGRECKSTKMVFRSNSTLSLIPSQTDPCTSHLSLLSVHEKRHQRTRKRGTRIYDSLPWIVHVERARERDREKAREYKSETELSELYVISFTSCMRVWPYRKPPTTSYSEESAGWHAVSLLIAPGRCYMTTIKLKRVTDR